MSHWARVASLEEIPTETGLEVTIGDAVLAVFQVNGDYFAIDGICAHAGGPVAEGELRGCIVTCPWHGWQYDVTTGQHCLNALIQQKSYAVKIEDNELYVELP